MSKTRKEKVQVIENLFFGDANFEIEIYFYPDFNETYGYYIFEIFGRGSRNEIEFSNWIHGKDDAVRDAFNSLLGNIREKLNQI